MVSSAWKTAKPIIIKKQDNGGISPVHYKPISLFPNISKTFKTIINQSINSFCRSNKIIPDDQFGYKFKHSPIHAITKQVCYVCYAPNQNNCVGAILIDLGKVFDTV